MTHKILVADDSATIQKVVSITLANEPCELIEARDAEAMFDSLQIGFISLVLLDFNISDTYSGYELAAKIKEFSPNTKIIGMLGTFDTVDNDKINQCGIEELVVKPFESSKFIQCCRKLISEVALEGIDEAVNPASDVNPSSEEVNNQIESDDLAQGWVTNSPELNDLTEEESPFIESEISLQGANSSNALMEELEGWGMEVPGVIGKAVHSEVDTLFPPQISGGNTAEATEYETDFVMSPRQNLVTQTGPETEVYESDEVYAEDDIEDEDETGIYTYDANEIQAESLEDEIRPVSLEEDSSLMDSYGDSDSQIDSEYDNAVSMSDEVEEEIVEDQLLEGNSVDFTIQGELTNDQDFQVEHKPKFQSIDDFKGLEDEEDQSYADDDHTAEIQIDQYDLEKEIEEEQNPETFWAVDEADQENVLLGEGDNTLEQELDQARSSVVGKLSEEDRQAIVDALTPKIHSMLEEIVKAYCEEKIDKVAWEVIPDLAENLISREIKELSDSVQE